MRSGCASESLVAEALAAATVAEVALRVTGEVFFLPDLILLGQTLVSFHLPPVFALKPPLHHSPVHIDHDGTLAQVSHGDSTVTRVEAHYRGADPFISGIAVARNGV